MANYSNNLGQIRLGWRTAVSTTPVNTNDLDATSFITAAGITDSTQISALNTLVNDLKTYGLWTKMKALYPFVGGSAASHKFNLKDPRDLDAAYRLVFNGGLTHNSNGMLGSINGYSDTKLNDNILLSNSAHFSIYSTTNIDGLYCDGGTLSSGGYEINIFSKYQNIFYPRNQAGNNGISNTSTSAGLFITNRVSSTEVRSFQNNSLKQISSAFVGKANLNIYLSALNNTLNGIQYNSIRNYAFSSIGDGLSDTEASNFYTSVQKFQTTLGRHVGTPYVSDPDAIAFLMAAGITDGTQAAAINTLVIRMKADGVWTKMKAIYPFVGGSATSHKFNLKDPRDLDAAYRLVFNGGWTHTSTGALPNGTTGYADTKLNVNNTIDGTNSHLSYYSRTTAIPGNGKDYYMMGAYDLSNSRYYAIDVYSATPNVYAGLGNIVNITDSPISNTKGLFLVKKETNNTQKVIINNITIGTQTQTQTLKPNYNIGLAAAINNVTGVYGYSTFESAFASIGDGLTDTEASNLYSAVQAYQTTLGRQVNIPVVSDTDAQSFLNAANITSFQQASAVNKLVVDLKAAGVWTKMKAIYPFVGGSAASHKFNLKDPRDLDAAYRLVFNGGWTHTSTGALPNGTTGYADTKLNESSVMTLGSQHISFYSRTNVQGLYIDMGIWGNTPAPGYPAGYGSQLLLRYTWPSTTDSFIGYSTDGDNNYISNNDSRGFFMSNRTSNSQLKLQKNSTINTFTSNTINKTNLNFYIGSRNIYNSTSYLYSPRESAFATIGDGLTDTEATSLYTAVQTYQTSLGRAVNTPVYNNGLVLNLDAGNANSYPGTGTTWFDLASGNNGTITNGPTYDSTNGGSITFDGVDDFVIINSILDLQGNKPFTVVGWFKKNSDWSNGATWGIGGGGDTLVGINSWNYNNANEISIDLWGTSTYTTNQTYSSTEWKHIAWVYNGTTFTTSNIIIYINSVPYTENNLSVLRGGGGVPSVTSGLVLGRAGVNDNGYSSKPKISKFSIYNRVLTQSEILNNFNSTRGRFGI